MTNIDDMQIPATQAAQAAAAVIAEKTGVKQHSLGLVLGSGWGGAAELLGETVAELSAEEVPGFTQSGVVGHSGTIRSIKLHNSKHHALVIGARTHFYEGRGVRRVAHGVRTLAACGGQVMILTNGCGSLRPQWGPGQVVLIKDHINLTAASPLEGANFVDLTDAYSPQLRALAKEIDPSLPEGVYVQFRGPHYETPAEVRMASILGGDLVGMSTSLETIAAREAGLKVLGLSLATNHAAGISATPLSHAEVLEAGQAAGPRISKLLSQIVALLAQKELQ